jgi:drug/metabolite transporter (DMT)-like permease
MRIGIILLLICTLLGAGGQFYFKQAAISNESNTLTGTILNINSIAGIILYGTSAILYIFALKYEPLSELAPLITLTYIWATLIGVFVFKEELTSMKWAGIALIVIGATLLIGGF